MHITYSLYMMTCAIIVPGTEVILSPFPVFVYLMDNIDNIGILQRWGGQVHCFSNFEIH